MLFVALIDALAVPVCTAILLRECDVTLYAPLDSRCVEYSALRSVKFCYPLIVTAIGINQKSRETAASKLYATSNNIIFRKDKYYDGDKKLIIPFAMMSGVSRARGNREKCVIKRRVKRSREEKLTKCLDTE